MYSIIVLSAIKSRLGLLTITLVANTIMSVTNMKKAIDFIKGHKLVFIEKVHEQDDIVSFVFKPVKIFDWKAGQHMLLTVNHAPKDKKGNKRMFSVSSAPHEDTIRITTHVPKDEPSSFKMALTELEKNTQIIARGPVGLMTLTRPQPQHVFLAGGIGITPFISLLRQNIYEKLNTDITLLYSNKTQDFLFQKEIDEIVSTNKNIKVIYSNERINENLVTKSTKDIENTIFFVSGPRPMVVEIKKLLKNLGAKYIKSDPFLGYK